MFLGKNKKRIFSILILLLAYGYIAQRFIQLDNFDLSILSPVSPLFYLLLLQLSLSVLNLLTESMKWRFLIRGFSKIKISTAYKMVLCGYSSGIFTPGKLGEPVGRMFFLKKEHWTKATALNYFGGFIQNLVIFSIGITAVLVYFFGVNQKFKNLLHYGIFMMVFSVAILYAVWISRAYLKGLFNRFKWKTKVAEMMQEIRNLTLRPLLVVAVFSFVRYLIYSLQLFLLLKYFHAGNDVLEIIILIPIYFLCVTLVPSFLLADLGIRNSVALILFSGCGISDAEILVSVSLLWVINQAIPAFAGTFFMLRKQ